MPKTERSMLLTQTQLLAFPCVSMTMLMQFSCWNLAISGKYSTAFAHLSVLTQLHPCMLVFAGFVAAVSSRLWRYQNPHRWPSVQEFVGVACGTIGVIISVVFDRHAAPGDATPPTRIGDFIALSMGVFQA